MLTLIYDFSAGTLTLAGGTGIVILNSLTSSSSGAALVIDSDFETHGDGTLTIQAGKTIDADDGDVMVTAWDLDLDGVLSAGTATMTIHGAKDDQSIGLGGAEADLSIAEGLFMV